MSGHTPGPWNTKRAKTPIDGEYDYAISAEFDGKPMVIAEAFGRVAPEIRPDAATNARLIAAAPDLLGTGQRLLELAVRLLAEHDYPSSADEKIVCDASAAQAKATGTTP